MNKILITGATGNIGYEVIRNVLIKNDEDEIWAGVRDIDKARKVLADFPELKFRRFDFEDQDTFDEAFHSVDIVFLLRPPHISDIKKYFEPVIKTMKDHAIKKVVFLSVQGAQRSSVIPHRKIEKLIMEAELGFIFLRPSYFMQNLTTTLISDIRKYRKIILPSGKAKFNWVDVKNIGEASAIVLKNFEEYQNQAFDITGYENKNFSEVAEEIKEIAGLNIHYKSVNPFHFYRFKRKEGLPKGMIAVMFLLHFLPRFQKEPEISTFFENITGKEPTRLFEFIEREKASFNYPFQN